VTTVWATALKTAPEIGHLFATKEAAEQWLREDEHGRDYVVEAMHVYESMAEVNGRRWGSAK